jgi:hypothetical protein
MGELKRSAVKRNRPAKLYEVAVHRKADSIMRRKSRVNAFGRSGKHALDLFSRGVRMRIALELESDDSI